jgi:hypothetical protein
VLGKQPEILVHEIRRRPGNGTILRGKNPEKPHTCTQAHEHPAIIASNVKKRYIFYNNTADFYTSLT